MVDRRLNVSWRLGMTDLSKKLNKYVKLSREQRQKRRKWLARQSEELELEAFVCQQKHYFELSKHKNENQLLLYFAAHTLAASEIYNQMHPQKSKNKVLNLNEINDNTLLEAKNAKNHGRSPKTDWLLDRKAKILGWSNNGMSTRVIEVEIRKKYKKKISHKTINDFLQKMKDAK